MDPFRAFGTGNSIDFNLVQPKVPAHTSTQPPQTVRWCFGALFYTHIEGRAHRTLEGMGTIYGRVPRSYPLSFCEYRAPTGEKGSKVGPLTRLYSSEWPDLGARFGRLQLGSAQGTYTYPFRGQ